MRKTFIILLLLVVILSISAAGAADSPDEISVDGPQDGSNVSAYSDIEDHDLKEPLQQSDNHPYETSDGGSSKISKTPSTVGIEVENATYPKAPEISYIIENVGVRTISIVDKDNNTIPYKVTPTISIGNDELGMVWISKLSAGIYKITIENAESENFEASSASAYFEVYKASSGIEITDVANATYPGGVSVSYSMENGTSYSVLISKDGVNITNAHIIENAPGVLTISNLAAGIYNVTVFNCGDENHTGSNASALFEVSRCTPHIEVASRDVNYPDNVTVTVTSDAGGVFTVRIGNSAPQTVTLEAGVGVKVNFTGLPISTEAYIINVTCAENENCTYAVNDTVRVWVKKIDTIINVTATSPLEGDNATVTLKVPREAGGNVTVQIGENTYEKIVDENGTAMISIPGLPAGYSDATVIYTPENANYSSKTLPLEIHVKRMVIIAGDMEMEYASGMDYRARLVDEDGNPVENRTLVFTIASKDYSASTDADGFAGISPGLAAGTYDVTVSCSHAQNASAVLKIVEKTAGNNNEGNTPQKDTVLKPVLKVKKTVKIKKSAKKLVLKATLKWSNGKPIKGKKITFKFMGKTYKAKTNKKGVAKKTLKRNVIKKLKKGKKYTVRVKYLKNTAKITVRVR